MAISSINSNAAALLAQINISNATTATSNHVAALSSGNRIVQASTDVAALATGTALQSQINTLTTSLTIASQGSSLLQVADGALAQITGILQRQQAIATQAQSGSLSSTQLGFLDQEFQNLTSAIDNLASSTNFNGVSLLNGSIAGGNTVASNAADGTSTSLISAHVVTFNGTASGSIAAAGDTITIDGVTVTFASAAQGTAAASGAVSIGTSAAITAANLAAFLNNANAPQFANLHFVIGTSAGSNDNQLYVEYTGGKLQGTLNITASANFASAAEISASATTLAAGGADGIGVNRYTVIGSTQGSILVNGSNTGLLRGTPVDLNLLANNDAFIGKFGGANISAITGTYTGTSNQAVFSLTAGDITYTSTVTLTASATAPIAATFTGHDSTGATAGGSFALNFNGAGQAFTSQALLDPIVAQLNAALSGVSVYQNRDVSSFGNGYSATVGGIQTATLQGASVDFNSDNFTNLSVSDISVSAPGTGSTDATFSVTINGEKYQSVSGIGNQIKTNTVIGLQNVTNPGKTISLVTGNTAIASGNSIAWDVSSSANASALQSILKQAFGIDGSNAALSFQIGSTTQEVIGVSIGSAATSVLYGGKSLKVTTQADAAVAANTLTDALNTVTSLRASVGALEERFTYASNAVQSAIQNEGAAKSTLLDTDVASTSTAFATAQVQLQAGIAVLAQANQLQQNLLKLIS